MGKVPKVLRAIVRFVRRAAAGPPEDGGEGSHSQPGFFSDATGWKFLPEREETAPEWERKDLGI